MSGTRPGPSASARFASAGGCPGPARRWRLGSETSQTLQAVSRFSAVLRYSARPFDAAKSKSRKSRPDFSSEQLDYKQLQNADRQAKATKAATARLRRIFLAKRSTFLNCC